MKNKYLKPNFTTLETIKISEIAGPLQTNYLHLYFQQVAAPQVGKTIIQKECVQLVKNTSARKIFNYKA
jgi:hypothetical protein